MDTQLYRQTRERATRFLHYVRKYPEDWDKPYGIYGCGAIYSPFESMGKLISRPATSKELHTMTICPKCQAWLEKQKTQKTRD